MRFKKNLAHSVGALTLCLSANAMAHNFWLLPNEFALSGDKAKWVTFDVTASNTTFVADKGVGLQDLSVVTPEGEKARVKTYVKGHRRSVFDWQMSEEGTYRFQVKSSPRYWTSYKMPGEEKKKWLRGVNKEQRDSQLPEGATEVSSLRSQRSSYVFVTRQAPTEAALKPAERGLAIQYDTHPSSVVAGEPMTLTFLFDGKKIENVEVEITPDGVRYRDNPETQKLKTNAEGQIQFTPSRAGAHLLIAEYEMTEETALYDKASSTIFLTFEAQSE